MDKRTVEIKVTVHTSDHVRREARNTHQAVMDVRGVGMAWKR